MKTVITHNGKFHADDVYAIALYSICHRHNIRIMRTRETNKYDQADIVIDVGGRYDGLKYFDHHQENMDVVYFDNTKYASFGMIFHKYGRKAITLLFPKLTNLEIETVFYKVQSDFVKLIDNGDNGEARTVLPETQIISGMNISSSHFDNHDKEWIFSAAIEFAKTSIMCQIDHAICYIEKQYILSEGLTNRPDPTILVLNKGIDWTDVIETNPEIQFVVFPGVKGENLWYCQAVPPEKGSFSQKIPFPLNWAGKRDIDLQTISKIKTATFCHKGRFIGGCLEKLDAIKMAAFAKNNQ